MQLKNYLPSPALRAYVQFFRIVHFTFSGARLPPAKLFPPRPQQYLAFYPFDRELIHFHNNPEPLSAQPAMFSGQQLFANTRHILGNNFLTLHIVFTPAGLHRLTGISAYELTNRFMDAESLLGTATRQLNEQLFHARDYQQMIQYAEVFMQGLINRRNARPQGLDQAAHLLLQDQQLSLSKLAQAACLSPRQLQRQFRERIGLSPKQFARAARFEKSFMLKLRHPDRSWTEIAYECQYSHYQHLALDYQAFTGLSPTAYEALDNQSPERLVGIAEQSYRENRIGAF
ncbi:MAG: helix-turn-helix domain-containing protein [Candidatus Pseudobacter hemicellulosilyticus]|uniref:Helix-turn-helix domain-containing protein n=1 Tax=Candidatus Pseudobacter hemicellulosilyticus TaxID=3121375 RepID=A0AAJ5WT75_9BACT|nr:MAG: helix-turn-helix domain-containing protein [Pseudobacter sp.]